MSSLKEELQRVISGISGEVRELTALLRRASAGSRAFMAEQRRLDKLRARRKMLAMQPGWVVQHVGGGQGTVVLVREFDAEVLVEWEDLSRTWENVSDLRVLN